MMRNIFIILTIAIIGITFAKITNPFPTINSNLTNEICCQEVID